MKIAPGTWPSLDYNRSVKTDAPNTKKGEKLPSGNKYNVICKGQTIDVYDVLMAFDVRNPADQHAIKKMLMPGKRGHKDAIQDRKEAIDSLKRAIELEEK